MSLIRFEVHGHPEPAGSKRAFAIKRNGQPTGQVAVADANPNAKGWQANVRDCALEHAPAELLVGSVALILEFRLCRPQGHYGTGRNAAQLKPSAPKMPAVRPDVLKLTRAVEDALTGVLWNDDAQITVECISKVYAKPEGVVVVAWSI